MGSKKRLPQMAGGSASALSLSRPAQALLSLRPAGSLSRPQATFVTRLQPMRLPAQAARQLPDQSTTLRVDSSSTDDSRLRGALPLPDFCGAAKNGLFNHAVGEQLQRVGHGETKSCCGLEIDDKLVSERELNRQIAWVRAAQYFVNVG